MTDRKLRLRKPNVDLDMMAELFIEPSSEHVIRHYQYHIHDEHDASGKKRTSEGSLRLWEALALGFRFRTAPNGGFYSAKERRELIKALSKHGSEPSDVMWISMVLLNEAAFSQMVWDFESALEFSQASLGYKISDPQIRNLRLTKVGFLLNYFRRFSEAEKHLREALKEPTENIKTWIYLGVSLEQQCQYEEAAECYTEALHLAGENNARPVMHLVRLLHRQPALKQVPIVANGLYKQNHKKNPAPNGDKLSEGKS